MSDALLVSGKTKPCQRSQRRVEVTCQEESRMQTHDAALDDTAVLKVGRG